MTFRPLPARTPSVLLRETRPLRALFGQAQRLAHLQRLLDACLQPAARAHCQIAAWRDGMLLLIVTDSHWATRLRYQERRLLRQLQAVAEFSNLQRILFKVRPSLGDPPARAAQPVRSHLAAESLQMTAAGIDDPRLRAALERLAAHVRPHTPGDPPC